MPVNISIGLPLTNTVVILHGWRTSLACSSETRLTETLHLLHEFIWWLTTSEGINSVVELSWRAAPARG